MKRLEEAKKLGDFLYVGIWDDQMVQYYKGEKYPIVSVQERILCTLACKHVDDVVMGAPYIITEDLIKSLHIHKVVHIVDTTEDTPKNIHKHIDQFEIPRKLGILEEVSISDPFYNFTIEDVAQRVKENKASLELKFKKKSESTQKYYENKTFVQEE